MSLILLNSLDGKIALFHCQDVCDLETQKRKQLTIKKNNLFQINVRGNRMENLKTQSILRIIHRMGQTKQETQNRN